MLHNRSGHGMSANAQTTHTDIELQGVGPYAGVDSPPPQTRPFTGVLDQHHCLLPQPQTRLSFPTSSQIPTQPSSSSPTNPQHRHSSGSQHPEKGHQRRHSSSSQKLRSGGRPTPPPPYSSEEMTEARREHVNGVSVTPSDENHVFRNSAARTDRDVDVAPLMMKETDLSTPSNTAPRSGGAECTQTQPLTTLNSVMEAGSDRPSQAIDWGDTGSANNDKMDGVLRKARNNYERLRADQSGSQHVYRPIVENSDMGRPSKANVTTPNPSKSSKPIEGAKSPLYDSADVCTLQVRPQSKPFLPSKRNQLSDHPDEIIELQSDVKSGRSREEKQNKSNAQKEVPEVTDIPNTNFAIACMVALCFNLPFGVLAMYFSLRAVKAFQEGRAKIGERRSRWSIVLSLLGITITTVIISSVVLYTAMQGQKRISRHKVYGTRAGLNL